MRFVTQRFSCTNGHQDSSDETDFMNSTSCLVCIYDLGDVWQVFFFFFTTCCMQLHKLGPGGILISDFSKRRAAVKVWLLFEEIYDPKTLWSKWFIFTESGRKHLHPQVWAQSSERTCCTSSWGCRVLKMIICCIIEKVKSIWVHFFKEDNVPWPEPQEYGNVRTAWKGESPVNTELLYCCVSGWKPTELTLVFQIFLRYENT